MSRASISSEQLDLAVEIDYLIVGLSTSSCALIRRILDACPSAHLMVLEAGQHQGASSARTHDVTSILTEHEKLLHARYPVSAHLGWGGSGNLHHTNVWTLNSPEHWDAYEEVGGAQDWSYDTISILLRELERFQPNSTTLLEEDVERRLRARQGVVPVQQLPTNAFSLYFAPTIAKLSCVNLVQDYNGGAGTGIDTAAQVWSRRDPPRATAESTTSTSCGERPAPGRHAWHRPVDTWLSEELNAESGTGPNLRVMSQVAVQRVLFRESMKRGKSKWKAVGVEYITKADPPYCTPRVMYARHVILSAGILGTSAILERSGIHDPCKVGTPLGIPTLIPNNNVGENLAHPVGPTMVIRRRPAPCSVATATDNSIAPGAVLSDLPSSAPVAFPWQSNHLGPVALLPNLCPSYSERRSHSHAEKHRDHKHNKNRDLSHRSTTHSHPLATVNATAPVFRIKNLDWRQWNLTVQPTIRAPSQFPQFRELYRLYELDASQCRERQSPCSCAQNKQVCHCASKRAQHAVSHLAQWIMYDVAPTSRGSIHIRSPHVFIPPEMHLHSYSTERDVNVGVRALQFMYRMFKALQCEHPEDDLELAYPPDETIFTRHALDAEKLEESLKSLLWTSIGSDAYCGQCRISRTRRTGVVNRRLQVHGTRRLYVCDMSVAPVPPDGDAVSTAMLIGMNCARMLLERRRKLAERMANQESDSELSSLSECSDEEEKERRNKKKKKKKMKSRSHSRTDSHSPHCNSRTSKSNI